VGCGGLHSTLLPLYISDACPSKISPFVYTSMGLISFIQSLVGPFIFAQQSTIARSLGALSISVVLVISTIWAVVALLETGQKSRKEVFEMLRK